ncbi:hypothetical protein D1BOALGB6SA_7104 [Olavius sp. associated proteobacterium Delta 1]|nr:hypothetical protein D1BOALGB6SA_7104 [Olavius sp. associated proteobacterium Delta 1]
MSDINQNWSPWKAAQDSQEIERQLMGILHAASAAKLTNDKKFMKLIIPAMINHDPDLVAALKQHVDQKIFMKQLDNVPFEQPSDNASMIRSKETPIIIGMIRSDEARPFIYGIDNFNQHVLVLGGSGVGKTVLLSSLSLQIMRFTPVIYFDHQKQDYRHMKRFKCARDLLVVKPQNLPVNFLQPPKGVNIQNWIVTFVTTFCKYNDLLSGSEGFLIKTMCSLYEDFGIFNGKDTYPTLSDLFRKIDHSNVKGNSRTSRFKESILNRLEAYLALTGDASEFSKGVPTEWIAKKNIVFELAGLTEHTSRFYAAMILQGLFNSRIASGTRGNIIRNFVVADECKYLTPPGYNPNLSFSPLTTLLSQARESGIGMVLADQTAQLEPSVFVNTKCKICFRLGDGADIGKAARSLSLSEEQKDYIPKLDTGECIVRIPGEDPFLIETLPINIE